MMKKRIASILTVVLAFSVAIFLLVTNDAPSGS